MIGGRVGTFTVQELETLSSAPQVHPLAGLNEMASQEG